VTDVAPASRNALCPCGSGRRYKHCHGAIVAHGTAPPPDRGAAQPDAETLFRLGNVCRDRGDLDGALEHYLRALPSAPGNAALLNNIGLVHGALGDADAAAGFFTQALAVVPNHPAALANLAQSNYQRRRDAEAVALFDRLIAAQPVTVAAIWANRGVCLARMGQAEAAAESFERALALEPDRLGVRLDAGNAYLKLEAFESAFKHFEAAHRLEPHCRFADSSAVALMQYLVRWDGFNARREHLLEVARNIDREPAEYLSPLGFLSLTDDPALQLQAARSAARHAMPQKPRAPGVVARRGNARLRLGFVSSDFRDHPVGRLVVGLLERLDRAQSEVFVYAIGPEWSDAIATRIAEASDRFVQVGWGYRDALGKCVRDDAIDVLFDLNGYTGLQVLEAFSRRLAPMQVNFLGYTGTLGCSAYDGILADSYCIPPAEEQWYEERVLRVDPCYLPSDPARELAALPLRRADYGLPDDALVLCCFARVYKIVPELLDGLQSILGDHPDAILWLRHTDADVAARVRAEAHARGIGRRQIAFAPPEGTARYLARFRLADLFVDTFPFGAHTTVNDALFAGLPVLAVAGRSFAARASASQVRAAGLPDFVAGSVADYFLKLRAYMDDPRFLSEAAGRLRDGTADAPLFDLDRYTRTFERVIHDTWNDFCRNAAS
jgi:predicted O-linked N-acetylglucosamine transferase (SPINDLY family)